MLGIVSRKKISFGIFLMLLAMFIMTLMDAAVKWVINDYSIQQVNFIRSIVAMIVLVPQVVKDGGLSAFYSRNPAVHFWRMFLIVVISYVWFFALGKMKLADIAAIVMISPLIITALSSLLLKEEVGISRWLAVILGFLGMLVIVRPGSGIFQPVAFLPALVAFGYALFILSNRANRNTESLTALTYYPLIGIFIVSGFLSPLDWNTPSANAFAVMIFIGFCSAVGHFALTLAFRYASPPTLAPLEYTGIIWAILLGYWIFNELPDSWTFVGMIMISCSGFFVIYKDALSSEDIPEVSVSKN